MRKIFELRSADAAGRIGSLEIPRADLTVETPALLPVVNPHIQTIPPADLREFGADMLITNAYVLYGSDEFRDAVETRGVHDVLGFDGAIMTDSGAFQLAEYGEIDTTNEEILQFQHDIGTDIATPIDIPTPPDADRSTAEDDLAITQRRLEAADALDLGDMLVTAPVQGSLYSDLREAAATHAYTTSLDIFPIGGVVPLFNEYRFADTVDVIAASKRGLGVDAPVHLFGAGHPMMFALAVAMGCDLFDSAAYAIYARDNRYLTVDGTHRIDTLDYLPCHCSICTRYTPTELRDASDTDRLLAEHNLYISFGEIRRIRQAIRSGNLLELVETRARAHPTMLDGYRALLSHANQLERADPIQTGTFFYVSAESARRPEVIRHHDRLDRLTVTAGSNVLLTTTPDSGDNYDVVWQVIPPFGPVPDALREIAPLTAEIPDRLDDEARKAAATGITRLVDANPDISFTFAHTDWPTDTIRAIPDSVNITNVSNNPAETSE